jgi:hypothetical protein
MRPRHAPAALVALLSVLAAGACGIPEDSRVTVVGEGPTSGTVAGDTGSVPASYTRPVTNDPLELVGDYLKAAAGDPDGAVARVKTFLTDSAASRLDDSLSGTGAPDVKVVRSVADPLFTLGEGYVTLRLQQIGTLKSNGVLQPVADPSQGYETYKVPFVSVAGKNGLFINDPPPVLLMVMVDSALDEFYQQRTIYFWDKDGTTLVPDVRYMPRSLPTVQQPTAILNWLTSGPAPWLSDAVQTLPSGTTAGENVPAINNGTLQITLGPQAVPPGNNQQLDRLRRQLQWSLRPLLPHTLELRIGKQDPVDYTDAEYLTSNRSYLLPNTPEKFVVFNGVVRRRGDQEQAAADPVPVLKPADNRGLAAAALSSSASRTFAAVVTAGKAPRLRVGSATRGVQGELKDVGGLSGTLGHPVWAVTDDDPSKAIGLITVNSRLYSFAGDGSGAQRVEWQGDPGAVSSVSVAPDGTRVAVVSGGKVYRAVLDVDGDSVMLSAPESLSPPTLASVSAVAWSSEGWLTVAGVATRTGRVAILDVSIDGALQHARLPDIGDKQVNHLAAYPTNPVDDRPNTNWVCFSTAAGLSFDAFSGANPIPVSSVYGVTGTPPAGAKPSDPFFLD